MINWKDIRKDSTSLKESLNKRGIDVSIIDTLLDLDEKMREAKTKSQLLSAERNRLAKEIGMLKSKKEDISNLLDLVAKTKEEEKVANSIAKEYENNFQEILSTIPNVLSSDVKLGKNEDDNILVRQVGEKKQFDFEPKEHFDLGTSLSMMDFEAASNLSGSRFVILSKDLALLERALSQFMLDIHVTENGYTEYSVPVIVNTNTLYNTGQLPKFKDDLFKIENEDKWLIPTTEVPLTNLPSNLSEKDLPKRYTGLSLCFRSEAGSAGRDTKGMLRQHQFYKVELVSITNPENSYEELERMLGCAEKILQLLDIPYRVMLLCSGDTGFSSSKTYDIEAFLPGQNCYREISSCSNCESFQARRMGKKFKKANGETEFFHTLNGSGLAVGRTLIAVLENYQNEDGSITVPSVLIPYMRGIKVIQSK